MADTKVRVLVDLGGYKKGNVVPVADIGGSMIDPSEADIAAMVNAGYIELVQ